MYNSSDKVEVHPSLIQGSLAIVYKVALYSGSLLIINVNSYFSSWLHLRWVGNLSLKINMFSHLNIICKLIFTLVF